MDQRLHPHFPKKGDLRIIKNYRGITLTFIAAKIYYALLLYCIKLEVKKILFGKLRKVFVEIALQFHRF